MTRASLTCVALLGAALSVFGCGGSADTVVVQPAPAQPRPAQVQVATTYGCPSGSVSPALNRTLPRNGGHNVDLLAEAVLIETNRARCARGLQPLITNASLQQAASLHSQDMARLNFFSHDSPVPGRERLSTRVSQGGYRFQTVAENIIEARYMAYEGGRSYRIVDAGRCQFEYANGQPIQPHSYASMARELVDRWMNSPGHRANILNGAVREHGFGLAPNRDQALCAGVYGAQVFAR